MKDTVFQQLLKPLTKELMQECVTRFRSDYNCEKFLTQDHLQTMIYAHIMEIKSLSTLEVAINSQAIGIKSKIKRSTLSDANRRRQSDCFFWILKQLMELLPRKKRKDLDKVIKILDSSPIQLRGSGYNEWAQSYATRRCQGLKLHMEYDLGLQSPTEVALSYPNYNDCSMGQCWPISPETIYIFDKGYCDFNWWWKLDQSQAFFITRLKKHIAISLENNQLDISDSILEDGRFRFKNKWIRRGENKGLKKNAYESELRRVVVSREGKSPLVLVTNLHDAAAETIANLYKARWEIELFFKWIKQNLKLKKFLGKSANAVKIQIATALIAYILIQFYKHHSQDNRRLQLVLIWVRVNLAVVRPKFENYTPPIYQFYQVSLAYRKSVQLWY